MNGRSVVFDALDGSEELKELGVQVMPNFGFEDAPKSPFIVLRWLSGQGKIVARREPRFLELWVNVPTSISRDFDDVDRIMAIAIGILEGLEQATLGEDWVTSIQCTGTGADQEDLGYNTITRNAGFTILAR